MTTESKITKGTFEPEGPLWETFNGHWYPIYSCAFCAGGFRQDPKGRGIGWTAHGLLCCSERCAQMLPEKEEDRPRFFDVDY